MEYQKTGASTGDREVSGKAAIEDLRNLTREITGPRPRPGSKEVQAIAGVGRAPRTNMDAAFKRGSHLVDTETTHEDVLNSERWLKATADRDGAFSHQIEALREKDYVYYLRCKTHYHQGIHFLVNPVDREIGPEDWVSSYKKAGEPWMNDIVCQECLAEGHTVALPFYWTDRQKMMFRAPRRHLFMIPRDPERFASEGGPRRIADLLTRSSNMERTVIEQHLAAEAVSRG